MAIHFPSLYAAVVHFTPHGLKLADVVALVLNNRITLGGN